MMRITAFLRSFFWKFGCGTLHCVNLLLAAMAVLQTGLILLNSIGREVPVPEEIPRWLVHRIVGDTYLTEWSRIFFDLRGGLFVEDFTVIRENTGEKVLDAANLQVNVASLNLLLGLFPAIDGLSGSHIRLFAPARLSQSGLNEPVLSAAHAGILVENGQLVVRNLLLETRDYRVNLTGSAPLRLLRQEPRPGMPEALVPDNLFLLLQSLPSRIGTDIRVRWQLLEIGRHQFSFSGLSDSLSISGIDLGGLRYTGVLERSPAAFTLTRFAARANVLAISPDRIPPEFRKLPLRFPLRATLKAHGHPVGTGRLLYPGKLDLLLNNPFPDLLPLRRLSLSASLSGTVPEVCWSARASNMFATGKLDWPHDSGDAQPGHGFGLTLRASFEEPLMKDFFPNLPDHRLLENARARHLHLNAAIDTASGTASGTLVADQLHIGQTDFNHLWSPFTLNREAAFFQPVHVAKSPSESATGAYFHYFNTSRFFLTARGTAFPASLDAILGNWWVRIFTEIEAPHPLPADVAVSGFWNDESTLQSVTFVHGNGASYRDVVVPQLEVRVRSNHQWAFLEHLDARFPDGAVSGSIAWRQNLHPNQFRPVQIDFSSSAPWSVVQQVTGINALRNIQIAGSPSVHASGYLWRAPKARKTQLPDFVYPQLRLELSHRKETCRVGALALGGLAFEGDLEGDNLRLDTLSGTFAEGVFTGRAAFLDRDDPEGRHTSLQIQLFDAAYEEALSQLAGLMERPRALRSYLLEDAKGGRVDADLNLLMNREFNDWKGIGRITLRQARIGRIHLFGGLSRLLDGMGLGFSSLDLNAGSIQWELENSRVRLAQCLLTGPVLNLDVAGTIDMESRYLDLSGKVNLFRGLFSKVLSPVSDNFEFDLVGPLEEPVWRLRLNPLRWFQNRLEEGMGTAR